MARAVYKVVFNACAGGFYLSNEALDLGRDLSGDPKWGDKFGRTLHRHDPILVKVVEKLGHAASGKYGDLEIAEVRHDCYYVEEHDGFETIHTPASVRWIFPEATL